MEWRNLLGMPRKEVDNPAWRAIFGKIRKPYSCGLACLATEKPSLKPFTVWDIKKVFAHKREFEDYLGVFKLRGGRYVCVRGAYCEGDETAYKAEAQVSCFLKEIIRFGLTERERRELNLLLPDDPGF